MKLAAKLGSTATAFAALGFAAAPAVHAQTLVDHYAFNDTGSTVIDSVGGQNGTLLNGATESGGSLITDGNNGGATSQYVSLGNSFILPAGSFSIEDFFTPAGFNRAFSTTFSFSQDTNNFILGTENRGYDGHANVDFGVNGGQTAVAGPVVPEVDNSITDFLITYNASTGTATAYDNGVLVGTASVPRVAFASGSTTGPFNGIAGGGPYGDNGLAGSTQDFRIFSGALTATQAVADFAAGPNIIATGAPAAAPEPSAWAALLMGTLGLGALSLRARRRSAMLAA